MRSTFEHRNSYIYHEYVCISVSVRAYVGVRIKFIGFNLLNEMSITLLVYYLFALLIIQLNLISTHSPVYLFVMPVCVCTFGLHKLWKLWNTICNYFA